MHKLLFQSISGMYDFNKPWMEKDTDIMASTNIFRALFDLSWFVHNHIMYNSDENENVKICIMILPMLFFVLFFWKPAY